MKPLFFSLGTLILLLIIFISAPSPIDAVAYQPLPAPPLIGSYQTNSTLTQAELHGEGLLHGPEDIEVDATGRIYGATADGGIVRINQDGQIETLANTKGRPLGLHWDAQNNLIICDAFQGLLSLSPDGNLTTLVKEVDGTPLRFTDDLEIASDGMIYFSDASTKYDQKHYALDMLEARPWGRLIRYNPNTQKATTLLQGLYLANGVALSQNEDFVLVNETFRYRIMRLWLKGPKVGQSEVFIDNLPGFPDGVSNSGRGTFWVALPTIRNAQADSLHPHPWLKNQMAKLPESLRVKPQKYGFVLELDENGEVLRSLHDPLGEHYSFITSAQERNGRLYLGSLTENSIASLSLAQAGIQLQD